MSGTTASPATSPAAWWCWCTPMLAGSGGGISLGRVAAVESVSRSSFLRTAAFSVASVAAALAAARASARLARRFRREGLCRGCCRCCLCGEGGGGG